MSARSAAAAAIASRIRAAFPLMSALVGLIWASATRISNRRYHAATTMPERALEEEQSGVRLLPGAAAVVPQDDRLVDRQCEEEETCLDRLKKLMEASDKGHRLT